MATRDKKNAGTELQSYNWENVPRALIQAAIAKCRRQDPPVTLKWQLTKLLKDWLSTD